MRIAILADPIDNQSAGVHVYTKNMVEGLIRHNIRHEYFIFRSKPQPKIDGAQNIVIPDIPGLATLRLFFVIPWIIRRMRIDCVIEPAHFGPFNLPATIKRITFIHDLTPLLFPHFHRFYSRTLQRVFLPGIMRKAAYLLANSQYTKQDICTRFPFTSGKVVVNHLGVDAIHRPVHSPETLSRYGITQPYFLFVGTIEPRKGLETLLDAFALFRKNIPGPFRLVIAGAKGWKTDSFFERLRTHPNREDILLTGFVDRDELPALYSMAFAFVYPSSYEGFGLPLLEAMVCGTPCITSRVSSLPEVCGDTALYFSPGMPGELYERMKVLYLDADLRAQMVSKGHQRAQVFTWEKHADRFNRLFAEIEASRIE